MTVLTGQQIADPQTWDSFVCAHPFGHLLQTWAWGELKAQFGWKPVRLALLDGERIVAGAQILFRRLPFGVSAMGYVPRGPAIAPDSPHGPDLLHALKQVACAERAAFVRIEPEWESTQLPTPNSQLPTSNLQSSAASLQRSTFNLQPSVPVQPRTTIHIDLRPDPDAILAQMKPKWRYNIRLAERKGIAVRMGGETDLAEFYRLMQITSARDGFPIHGEAYYRAAWQLFSQRVPSALLVAEFEGKPIAMLMAFACGRKAIYLYGASSDEERNRMPNHLLQWRALQWAKAQGCEVYDLWGVFVVADRTLSADEQTNLMEREENLQEGLLRFKQGFGGRVVQYAGAFDIVYQPLLYRALNWLIAKRKVLR